MNAIHSLIVSWLSPVKVSGSRPQIRVKDLSLKILTILGCLMSAAPAVQFGDFAYTDNGTSITIDSYSTAGTGYPAPGSGVVAIPATFDDKPVTAIGISAFQACATLTSISIPASVTSIGANAFSNCSALASVTLPSGLTGLSAGIFYNCVGLTSMNIPSGVTSIGANAFTGCKLLTSIVIPSGVTTVGAAAFSNCGGLTGITFPSGVTVMPGGIFSSCSSLTSVVMQGAVTSIGNNAFQYCSKLTSLVIPASVTSIGRSAFADCKELAGINIPASVATIGTVSSPNVFVNCSALTAITVDAANPNFSSVGGVLTNKSQTMLITYPGGLIGAFSVPSSVTNVGVFAFVNCSKLTSVTFPSGLTGIGSQAFSNCTALVSANFTGNAPTTMFSNVFEVAAAGFAVYYPSTVTGFTSPWYGYPAFSVVEGGTVSDWLVANGFPAGSDIQSDPNGDGVNLLMAYALNLNPNENLSGSLPQPVITASQMSLSFYSGAAGVAYVVQSSSDMIHWSASGVTVSAPDANQVRTAAVSRSGPSCFMRLAVSR